MGKGRKPKGKHVLEIHFDSKVGLGNFTAWYHNSGEQDSNYYADAWGETWMHVKAPDDVCPKCEFDNDNQSKFYDNRTIRKLAVVCENCGHAYVQKNPYMADGT